MCSRCGAVASMQAKRNEHVFNELRVFSISFKWFAFGLYSIGWRQPQYGYGSSPSGRCCSLSGRCRSLSGSRCSPASIGFRRSKIRYPTTKPDTGWPNGENRTQLDAQTKDYAVDFPEKGNLPLETKGHKKKGKRSVSHRYNHLPLLHSCPGGFSRSWSHRTYPSAKVELFFVSTTFKTWLQTNVNGSDHNTHSLYICHNLKPTNHETSNELGRNPRIGTDWHFPRALPS